MSALLALLAVLSLSGCGSSTSTRSSTGSSFSSVVPPRPSDTAAAGVAKYCAAIRSVADFEAKVRAAGPDAQQLAAIYAADADTVLFEYETANHSVPVDDFEVHVGLNLGELFTERIADALAAGKALEEANAPRSDVDWIRSQPKVDRYTMENCGFVVYEALAAALPGQ